MNENDFKQLLYCTREFLNETSDELYAASDKFPPNEYCSDSLLDCYGDILDVREKMLVFQRNIEVILNLKDEYMIDNTIGKRELREDTSLTQCTKNMMKYINGDSDE